MLTMNVLFMNEGGAADRAVDDITSSVIMSHTVTTVMGNPPTGSKTVEFLFLKIHLGVSYQIVISF